MFSLVYIPNFSFSETESCFYIRAVASFCLSFLSDLEKDCKEIFCFEVLKAIFLLLFFFMDSCII